MLFAVVAVPLINASVWLPGIPNVLSPNPATGGRAAVSPRSGTASQTAEERFHGADRPSRSRHNPEEQPDSRKLFSFDPVLWKSH
jgi:hypothetical protein